MCEHDAPSTCERQGYEKKRLRTFLSLGVLAVSSLPTAKGDKFAALAGFLAISISCCNDSGDPGLAASWKLGK